MDYVLELVKKLENPKIERMYKRKLFFSRFHLHPRFKSENEFQLWFSNNILKPQREIYLKNKLKSILLDHRDILPEIKNSITSDTLNNLNNVKNVVSGKRFEDVILIINSLYFVDSFRREFEAPLPKFTSDEINANVNTILNNATNDTYINNYLEEIHHIINN